jgi:hypothetical protein
MPLSTWSDTDKPFFAASVPDPAGLQNIQPPNPTVPSLLGQPKPASKAIFLTGCEKSAFSHEDSDLYLGAITPNLLGNSQPMLEQL